MAETVEIRLPQLSMGVIDCRLNAWLKQVGDRVEKGEAVAEVDTDKTIAEINAPESGVLAEIRYSPGDMINVGDVMAVVRLE